MKTQPLFVAGLRLLVCLLSTSSFAQPGNPDIFFSGNGYLLETVLSQQHNVGIRTLVQPDGKIVVGAAVYGSDIQEFTSILRFLPNGDTDPAFNGNAPVSFQISQKELYMQDMALLPDGKLLVCVNVYNLNNALYTPTLFRLLPDGSLDPDFGGAAGKSFPAISGFNNLQYRCLKVQSDGKIVVAGYATPDTPNANEQLALFRLLSNGMPDPAFSSDGFAATPVGSSYASVSGVEIQADGKIVVAGTGVVNGLEDFAVARFTSSGMLDAGFDGDGIGLYSMSDLNDRSAGICVQNDGKLVLGGYANFGSGGTGSNFAALRLNANGAPDTSFDGDGKVVISASDQSDGARSILLQPDGKIVLGGYTYNDASYYDVALVRLYPDGTPDNSFGGDGISTFPFSTNNSDIIYGMALQPDGKIIATGLVRVDQYNQILLARFVSGIVVDAPEVPAVLGEISLYPNPVYGQGTLSYTLRDGTRVRADLYNAQGQLIQNVLQEEWRSAGKQVDVFTPAPHIPPGAYFVRLAAGQEVVMVPVFF